MTLVELSVCYEEAAVPLRRRLPAPFLLVDHASSIPVR